MELSSSPCIQVYNTFVGAVMQSVGVGRLVGVPLVGIHVAAAFRRESLVEAYHLGSLGEACRLGIRVVAAFRLAEVRQESLEEAFRPEEDLCPTLEVA